jgi:hypothetical protein
MKRTLLILLCLVLSSCNIFPIPFEPNIPSGCRNFGMTTWAASVAPWNDVDWSKIGHIDEPMLSIWGWPGDIKNPADVCGPIGTQKIRAQIDAIHAQGKRAWLNWSTEELIAVAQLCPNEPIGLNADIVSFDAYGGPWDWYLKSKPMLEYIYSDLRPGQQMGMIPEGHYTVDWGVTHSDYEYSLINRLYFDWAMRHDDDGKIFAMAPFTWGPCKNDKNDDMCIADRPSLIETLSTLAADHPRCQ